MIKEIERLLRQVSEMIMTTSFEIKFKDKDIVTNMDVEAERNIIKALKVMYPNDLYISEEENHNELTDDPTWIIDPIDGTLNYTRNIPQFGIQLSRYIKKKPVFAMMYFPVTDVLVYAEKDKGCYINHDKVDIKPLALNKSILTFGDFSSSQPSSRPIQLQLMANAVDQVMKIRIYGASSSDFSYVIEQKTQCHIIFTKRIWELAAGVFLAEEAGLQVKALEYPECKGYAIGHPQVIEALKL